MLVYKGLCALVVRPFKISVFLIFWMDGPQARES